MGLSLETVIITARVSEKTAKRLDKYICSHNRELSKKITLNNDEIGVLKMTRSKAIKLIIKAFLKEQKQCEKFYKNN